MDWSEYKLLCDSPDVLSRFLLEITASMLSDEPVLRRRLHAQLTSTPLPTPADHHGPSPADMYAVDINVVEAHAIATIVGKLPDSAGSEYGLTSLAGVRAAWGELAEHHASAPEDEGR
ncbi:MAG: hypothetical protein NXH85_06245 [Pseudomonadaceae bacterium]|nr:hypothetical protein [Pseudomonadaceae bacterium]